MKNKEFTDRLAEAYAKLCIAYEQVAERSAQIKKNNSSARHTNTLECADYQLQQVDSSLQNNRDMMTGIKAANAILIGLRKDLIKEQRRQSCGPKTGNSNLQSKLKALQDSGQEAIAMLRQAQQANPGQSAQYESEIRRVGQIVSLAEQMTALQLEHPD